MAAGLPFSSISFWQVGQAQWPLPSFAENLRVRVLLELLHYLLGDDSDDLGVGLAQLQRISLAVDHGEVFGMVFEILGRGNQGRVGVDEHAVVIHVPAPLFRQGDGWGVGAVAQRPLGVEGV